MSVEGSKARLCTFCKHPYIHPCDGKNLKCPNKLWLENPHPVKEVEKPPKKRVRLRVRLNR